MFLITAAILIVILILLKTSANLPSIIQQKRELEVKFEREFFIDIVDELVKVIEISYHQSNNITKNVFNFGNFTRRKMTERSMEFQFLYVGCITPKVGTTMNVTVVNLLDRVINATLQLNSSTPANFSVMVDSSSWDINYTINQGSNYILTLGYNETYQENITIQTQPGKSIYVGFFDVTFTGLEDTYKDKFQKSYTLP